MKRQSPQQTTSEPVPRKNLRLHKDTLRKLTRDDLGTIVGGRELAEAPDVSSGTASRPIVPHPTSHVPTSPRSGEP